jgi:hypothetical protein
MNRARPDGDSAASLKLRGNMPARYIVCDGV